MKELFLPQLVKALSTVGVDAGEIKLEFPENPEHGDYSTNIALVSAKKLKTSPRALAERIVEEFKREMPDAVATVEVAGAGFINFRLKDEVFAEKVIKISADSKPAPERTRGVLRNCECRSSSSAFPRSTSPLGHARACASGNANDADFAAESQFRKTPLVLSGAANAKEVLIEYTDPNAFKVFHIGHLMANAIGESLSRLIEYSGAKVTRICYPSDIGLHIAKSIWAMRKHSSEIPSEADSVQKRTEFLGKMYVEGTKAYEDDPTAKKEIDVLNGTIYGKLDAEINELYEKGKKWSFEHFELLYKRLGTKFDDYIYESDMAPVGLEIVKEYLKKGVFEESEGATVFRGEKYGLHTRVFVNSAGLPIYEAKDLGLNATKFERYPDSDQSIIVTANEQNDYFKVLIKALSLVDEKAGAKTKHIGHGLLRFASGKMSSRTGKVIAAEALVEEIKEMVRGKMEKSMASSENPPPLPLVGTPPFSKGESARQDMVDGDLDRITDVIAIGAIKYTILRQSIGSDVIFDSAKSISFEGDSGPYLQYSAVRAGAVLEKAQIVGMPYDPRGGTNMGSADTPSGSAVNERNATASPASGSHRRPGIVKPDDVSGVGSEASASPMFASAAGRGVSSPQSRLLDRLIVRFPEIIERARDEYAPQLVANYLITLAGEFNSFYAKQTIVDKNDPMSPYYVALTRAFRRVMEDGLWVLGIGVPEKM